MKTTLGLLLAACLGLAPALVSAEQDNSAIISQAVPGPTQIKLRDQAVLSLPDGYFYLPAAPAAQLMAQMGNTTDERFLGIIFQPEANWFVDLEYEASGYVKDDDAKEWDADELLDSLKEGTEAANENRRQHNVPEIEVTGWAEKPMYEAGTHRLVWSALAKEKNAPAGQPQTVNYNTYALGREGYISLNLITDSAHIDSEKRIARELLGALAFNSGKRYEDFNSSTDKVAAYGLSALVAGAAAKKLGLLAMIGAFFAKFFKVIVVAAIAGLAGLGKLFGRKK